MDDWIMIGLTRGPCNDTRYDWVMLELTWCHSCSKPLDSGLFHLNRPTGYKTIQFISRWTWNFVWFVLGGESEIICTKAKMKGPPKRPGDVSVSSSIWHNLEQKNRHLVNNSLFHLFCFLLFFLNWEVSCLIPLHIHTRWNSAQPCFTKSLCLLSLQIDVRMRMSHQVTC